MTGANPDKITLTSFSEGLVFGSVSSDNFPGYIFSFNFENGEFSRLRYNTNQYGSYPVSGASENLRWQNVWYCQTWGKS